jgi:hypothetical protein
MAEDKHLADLSARLERLEGLLLGRIPPVFDPSPDDWGRWGGSLGWRPIPIPWPNPGDPVPIDISRLTRAQLQVSLESIKAQRIRLDAMETMINQQLKQTK